MKHETRSETVLAGREDGKKRNTYLDFASGRYQKVLIRFWQRLVLGVGTIRQFTSKEKKVSLSASYVGIPLRKGLMVLLASELAAEGSAKFRKVLVDYAPFDGPNELVVDQDGNLDVAVRAENRTGNRVYSLEG